MYFIALKKITGVNNAKIHNSPTTTNSTITPIETYPGTDCSFFCPLSESVVKLK
jgi:hypothetical protein